MKLKHILYLCFWLSGAVAFSPLVAQASRINDTGITTCSNATQDRLNCPVTGFPRQDAEYGPNSFNFTKLDAAGNPLLASATNHVCIMDNYTGLIWEVKTADGGLRDKNKSYTFDGASAFATAVNTAGGLCGFTDWRLPNPQELNGLINYGSRFGPTIDTNYFPNSLSQYFWTNSSYAGDLSQAWVVYFDGGYISHGYRTYYYNARLVRGGESFAFFHANGDGTVTDANTGLMWAQCAEGRSGSSCTGSAIGMTWGQALTAATTSTLAGYNDWRVPNIKELHSLVKYSNYNPSIDIVYFPNPKLSLWSSSSEYSDSEMALNIDFQYGSISYSYKTDNYAVRLVRYLTFVLGASKAGTGTGGVTSSPSGINCGTTCIASYAASTVVTLTATPDTGSVFTGWSGDADCTDGQVTIDADKTCIATFTKIVVPTVSTDAPPSVITTTTARIIGTVNPNNADTSVSFGYGLTNSYGTTATATPSDILANTGATSVYADISGLTFCTTYHYQVIATNSAGTTSGNDQSFTTSACSPVTTNPATNILPPTATLNGVINVGAATGNTTAIFQYGTTTEYGGAIQGSPYNVGSGTSNVAITANLTGLTCGTLYHYRLKSGNNLGTKYGSDQTFTTSACTVVTTGAASSVTVNSAVLAGTVDVGEVVGNTTAIFQYGTDTSYSNAIQAIPYLVASGTSNVNVSAAITSGLNCNTTYHYRLKAGNAGGTIYGSDQTFTTGACTVVTTGAATTNIGIVTLNGIVDVGATTGNTTAIFQYSKNDSSYGNAIQGSPYNVNPGTSNVAITANLTGLSCGSLYHYRLKSGNVGGTVYGSDQTFTTVACTTVTIDAPTSVANTTATLNGVVNVGGVTGNTSAVFQYSLNDTSYSSAIMGSPYLISYGTSNVAVTANLTRLSCGLYHYRLKAGNTNGTVYSPDGTFVTCQ